MIISIALVTTVSFAVDTVNAIVVSVNVNLDTLVEHANAPPALILAYPPMVKFAMVMVNASVVNVTVTPMKMVHDIPVPSAISAPPVLQSVLNTNIV